MVSIASIGGTYMTFNLMTISSLDHLESHIFKLDRRREKFWAHKVSEIWLVWLRGMPDNLYFTLYGRKNDWRQTTGIDR